MPARHAYSWTCWLSQLHQNTFQIMLAKACLSEHDLNNTYIITCTRDITRCWSYMICCDCLSSRPIPECAPCMRVRAEACVSVRYRQCSSACPAQAPLHADQQRPCLRRRQCRRAARHAPDSRVDVCVDMYKGVCADMCTSMCTRGRVNVHADTNVSRHVEDRDVDTHVNAHVCRRGYITQHVYMHGYKPLQRHWQCFQK